LREGKNREVKKLLAHLGLATNRLIRISYGPFQIGELADGEVLEIRGRVLRDQLGSKLAREAHADFDAEVRPLRAEPVPVATDKRAKPGRGSKPARSDKSGRESKRDREERAGRENSRERENKPGRLDRRGRAGKPGRTDKPGASGSARPDKPTGGRPDRPGSGRQDRPGGRPPGGRRRSADRRR
jgi:23S rRNA pseudouridine2605 synthase